MNRKITRQDVVEAAAAKGIPILEALNMMQAVAATKAPLSSCARSSVICFSVTSD